MFNLCDTLPLKCLSSQGPFFNVFNLREALPLKYLYDLLLAGKLVDEDVRTVVHL